MDKKKRLGLIFSNGDDWIGGVYYILNLVHALKTLPDDLQPHLVVLSRNCSDANPIRDTGYKYLSYLNSYNFSRGFFEKLMNTPLRKIFGCNIIDKRITNANIDFLFPAIDTVAFERIAKKIYWFPDFQHKHYPENFSKEEIDARDSVMHEIANGNLPLILSSESAKKDFEAAVKSYTCQVKVIPFAVSHPSFDHISMPLLRQEYNIQGDYFIVPNQWWEHKNQLVVLKAIALFKKEGSNLTVVFTGKESDRRNLGYYQSALDYIEANHIQDYVRILGLIPREKQLKLMKEAKAIIQPSLFEGWSTVVEDAKALNQPILVSDIEVHREQINANCTFFDPHDPADLAGKIKDFSGGDSRNFKSNYNEKVIEFGRAFVSLLES